MHLHLVHYEIFGVKLLNIYVCAITLVTALPLDKFTELCRHMIMATHYYFILTILSWSFPTLLKSDTGRKLDGSELSPSFGNGITFENFQISENLPSLKDLLNKIFSGTETSWATAFSILLLISSGPVALFRFHVMCRVSLLIYFDIYIQKQAKPHFHH